MNTPPPICYKRHRYPAAIISQCVWLYFRFALSFRDVELMMVQRGVVVSYESIQSWCEKLGRQHVREIPRQRGRMGDVWHLDEVYLKIKGVCQYLWRAVDQEGQVLDILVQPQRDKVAAERFFKKVLRAHAKHQGKWSQTGWLPTPSPVLNSCPMQPILISIEIHFLLQCVINSKTQQFS